MGKKIRRNKMSKYDKSWAEANKPQDPKFGIEPLLIVLSAAEMIVILSLINNCGGFLL